MPRWWLRHYEAYNIRLYFSWCRLEFTSSSKRPKKLECKNHPPPSPRTTAVKLAAAAATTGGVGSEKSSTTTALRKALNPTQAALCQPQVPPEKITPPVGSTLSRSYPRQRETAVYADRRCLRSKHPGEGADPLTKNKTPTPGDEPMQRNDLIVLCTIHDSMIRLFSLFFALFIFFVCLLSLCVCVCFALFIYCFSSLSFSYPRCRRRRACRCGSA